MEVISIKVLFTNCLNATINEESISADFESFKWKFINEFCDTLKNYLTENDCEIHENTIKNISFNDNKTTIVGGLSFSVKSSYLIFNQLI
jgi:hypothetical protein